MGRSVFIILLLPMLSGCLWSEYLFVETSFRPEEFVNYALQSNGGRVRVSEDNPEHPASTLINGIKDSNLWDQGEGWELPYSISLILWQDNMRRVIDMPAVESLGWVIIDLPEPKLINRIVIYTINSKEYPAARYGVKNLVIQYKPYNPRISNPGWFAIERIDRIRGQPINGVRDNKSGVIDVRFKPVYTQSIMISIQDTNDMKRVRTFYLEGKIRLLEIEVYGRERRSKGEEELF
ncbi:TPA: hypothetical protein EYP37_10920 [Candidatus Poribacteria bacterium]|nr:hypothetical protein [Candidatus Poribacteria bacterium]